MSAGAALSREPRELLAELRARVAMDPAALVRTVVERLGDRVALASSLGPGSLALLDMAWRAEVPLRVFVLDTGMLFDETLELWRRIEARYGMRLEPVRPAPEVLRAQVAGERLWERDPDACCAQRKVEPLRRLLTGLDAWVTGIRRDQGGTRAAVEQVTWDDAFGVVKLNPLAHWTRAEVDAYLARHDVPVNALVARGYRSVGCWPCTRPVAPGESERAGRWAGRAKTECGIHSRLAVGRRTR